MSGDHDPVNAPRHYRNHPSGTMFGGNKKWADRKVAMKPCRQCAVSFQPSCGGNIYCAGCVKEVRRKSHADGQRAWRAKDPARHAVIKEAWDLKKYGLTRACYDVMLASQGGVCAICATETPGGRGKIRSFVVDHCHISGVVRGLLCHTCNTAIGLLKDDPKIVAKAVAYLERST